VSNSPGIFKLRFLHPRYWLNWLGYFLFWITVHTPQWSRIRIGAFIGWLGYYLSPARRHIADINLKLCFPDMDETERRNLCKRVFRSTGISSVETAMVWIRRAADFRHLVTIHGLENLRKAQAEGKGVILLGMHLSTLDLCGAVLSFHTGFDVMYRRNKNLFLEAVMTRGRQRNFPAAIKRDDVRGLIRNLIKGHIVWYGPDQDYGKKHSVFAPFYNIETATITATARIARITKSPVITFTHYRKPDGSGYDVYLSDPLENYPGNDEIKNASLVNNLVEAAIARSPEQYLWLHRRFKTRPAGEPRPY
jgi:KDO2-lipid IV(A) lauroyltransferase